MNKTFFLLFLVSLSVIQGCADGGKWIKADHTLIDPAPGGYVKTYVIGQSKSAFIGQAIIGVTICDSFKKTASAQQNLYIMGRDRSTWIAITRAAHTQLPITGTVKFEGKTYYAVQDGAWGMLVSNDGNIYDSGLYNYNYQKVYPMLIPPNKFEFSDNCIRQPRSSISFELIYTGKNDISLNATYKEFSSEDLARPAFFQNLTYQANAQQIRFKDFMIKIHDVSNEKITYTVLEDGLK